MGETKSNIEVEGKILNVSPENVAKKLKEINATFINTLHYKRYVFDTIPSVESRWIRLRTDGTKTTLTAKEIQNDSTTGTSEWEVVVSDLETTLTILNKIGISPKAVQENYRLLFEVEGDEVTIDFWPGLDPYIEIESADHNKIENIAGLLGYKAEDITGINTQGLYKKKGVDLDSVKELTFEVEPKDIKKVLLALQ